MAEFNIFRDIAQRTNGDIYIGVLGPVRTGKSSFIKRFMELLVIPYIEDPHERERTIDELPQGGAGRTVMTTEPKFVPDEAVEVSFKDELHFRVRLVDSVGYPVDGALGYEEDDGPRLVDTPWFDYEIPFEEAAEIGSRKVLTDHATIGLVITTDGSFGDITRDSYVPAEEKIISEISDIGKPFIVVLNSKHPMAAETQDLAIDLEEKYGVPVIPLNISQLTEMDLYALMEEVLYEFPVREMNITLPDWVEELDSSHWLRQDFERAVTDSLMEVTKIRDVQAAVDVISQFEFIEEASIVELDMGEGIANVDLDAREELFWDVMYEMTGYDIRSKGILLRLMKDFKVAKEEYDKISGSLLDVRERGYGIVEPDFSDIEFEEPELIKKGNQFGVRLRANASTLHFFRVHVATEVTPMIGTEKQSEQLVNYLMEKFEDDPRKIWETDIFGKSLDELLREGINDKLASVPENARTKLRETLERIANEGGVGLICIII